MCLLTEPLCHQEEVRICTTTVFVDPYEEADAQVRKGRVGPEDGAKQVTAWLCWLGAGGAPRPRPAFALLLAGGEEGSSDSSTPSRLPRSGRRHSSKRLQRPRSR